ncbi:MAG: zinc ribbon domain-containing protein [Clostridiales bacterium]|nr:zinc ribbon domain-containing protein [Clostridiales bacterium]
MFCGQCGRQIPDSAKFCGFCGAKFEKEKIKIATTVKPEAKPEKQTELEASAKPKKTASYYCSICHFTNCLCRRWILFYKRRTYSRF